MPGREWRAGEPGAAMLCDEAAEPGGIDQALHARVAALTTSGLVNAIANRCTLRMAQEPPGLFRGYMATFAVEQARCHRSAALVRNLELNWHVRERSR